MKKNHLLLFLFLGFIIYCKSQNTRVISYFDTKFNKAYYLAWDIKSGKNIQYYWGAGKWEVMSINLPSTPLPNAKGDIMFEAYFDTKFNTAYYIVWDVKTGKNLQYYWGEGKWKTMSINLPEVPLPNAKGDIYIKPYFDQKFAKAYYIVYDSTEGRSIQYYWNNGAWEAMSINLPEILLK